MNDFTKALAITATPIVALSVFAAVAFRIPPINFFFSLAAMLAVIALFTGIGFLVAGKRMIAAGIFAGFGIGVVALSVSCFASFARSFS